MGWLRVRAPCCELIATALLTVPSDERSITDLYADPWLAPAARAGRRAGRRSKGIHIRVIGSRGSTIAPRRFADVHRPDDSRWGRLWLEKQISPPAAPVGLPEELTSVETRSVIGAEFANEHDSLERRRRGHARTLMG